MSYLGADVCGRCMTTHPLNENGERVCPKPPLEEKKGDGPLIVFKGTGWYHTDSRVIKTPNDVA